MRMRSATVVLALLAVVVSLASAPRAQSRSPIRLAIHTQVLGAADAIAVRQGYFKEQGLEVEWRRFALGKDGRDAMIAGAIDINATAPTPYLIGADKAIPFTAIAINSLFCGTNHIVVLKQSDINSVAQLKGKKIGLPKGTITEHVFLTKMAPAAGLKTGDFAVANIPDSKDRIPSLVAKAVEAVALGDPFTSIGEHEGLIRAIDNYCKYDPLPFIITATNKIVKDNPEAVVAYLRGWLRAVKLLQEEPEKAAAVYAEEQKAIGHEVPVAVLDRALRRMRWEPEITPAMERYLAEQAKDLLAGGQIKTAVDVSKGLNRELLQKAKAGR
jgi:sulfonate transport system substrate-binding protein